MKHNDPIVQKHLQTRQRYLHSRTVTPVHHYQRRCPIYVPSILPFIFTAIHKAASTSILKLIAEYYNLNEQRCFQKYIITDFSKFVQYSNIFYFVFVRNPWERLVSYWAMRSSKEPEQTEDFQTWLYKNIYNGVDAHLWPQVTNLYYKDKFLPTFAGRFENLNTDWKIVQENTGLPTLKHLNKSKHKHYREYYTKDLKDLVARRYKEDIDLFKYAF